MAMNDTRQKPVRQWLEDIFTAGADAQVRRMLHLGPLLAHIEAEIKDMVQTLPALIQIDSAGGAPPQEQAKTVTSPATKLLLRAVERLVSDLSASASSNNSNNNSNNDNDKDENDDDNGIPPDLLPTIASIATGVEEDLAQVLPSAPSAPSAPAGYVGLEPFAQGNAQYAVAIAVLGWTTMLFSWVRADASPGLNGGLGVGIHGIGVGRVQTTSTPKRVNDLDLSADVRAFVDTYQCVPSTYDQGAHMENLLHASLLNYHSLFYIGGLKIEWVPRISEHLVLDTKAKTLRLFKYPSLCALARCGGSYQTATETILQDGNNRNPSPSIHREVLLSLRFLLGRSRRVRRTARRMAFVDLPDRDRDALFDPLLEGKVDYLLAHDVPVKRAAAAAAAANPAKDDSLTPWTDFPLLGERLLKLQQYNRDQQPTSTRGMLRDHRNPAQWYTLWAVLIMGFISLVLSAAQLGVGIAQLKAA